MKRLLLLSAALIVFAAVTNAQVSGKKTATINKKANLQPLKKMVGKEVSPAAKQDFSLRYCDIPAVWKRTTNYDEVSFTDGGEAKTSYYGAGAKTVGTIMQKKFEDLPNDALATINEKCPGYKKESVVFFDDNELNTTDIVVLNKQFEDEDCYFVQLKKRR